MNNIIDIVERKVVPIASKIGSQRHLVAIRDSFAGLMPIIMAGAIAVLVNNVLFVPWGLLAGFIGAEHPFILFANEHFAPFFSIVDSGTLALLSLALVNVIAQNRAREEGEDPTATSIVAIGSFMLLGALYRNNEIASSYITNFLGVTGIFVGIFVGLIASEIYIAVVKKGWVIKLPDTVPPAVAKGFSGIIPGMITIFIFAIVSYCFTVFAGVSIFTWFENNISDLFLGLSQGLGVILFVSILLPLFWFFGLHGANLLEAFLAPTYGTLGTQNLQMFSQEGITTVKDGLAVWVRNSWDIYTFIGGAGALLMLIIAILVFGKVKEDREIARLSLVPAIFQINEPISFGLPVVLNPIYLIPLVFSQPIMAAIGYFATSVGFAGPIVNSVPWTTPPVLNAYLATNGDLGATLVSLFNAILAFGMYVPFVMIANRTKEVEEK